MDEIRKPLDPTELVNGLLQGRCPVNDWPYVLFYGGLVAFFSLLYVRRRTAAPPLDCAYCGEQVPAWFTRARPRVVNRIYTGTATQCFMCAGKAVTYPHALQDLMQPHLRTRRWRRSLSDADNRDPALAEAKANKAALSRMEKQP